MEYPPFSDLIQILFEGDETRTALDDARSWMSEYASLVGKDAASRILPLQQSGYAQEGTGYRGYALIKSPPGKRFLYLGAYDKMKEQKSKKNGNLWVSIDINPYTIWRNEHGIEKHR